MAYRILFRNYPDSLSQLSEAPLPFTDEATTYMEKLRSSRSYGTIKGFRNDSKLDCTGALKNLHRMREKNKLDKEQLEIMDWLDPYITGMAEA